MARIKQADFLEHLAQAATRVLAKKGLKRTRMSDVAKEMGVSQGTIYNYVESKEALFYLLVDVGIRTAPLKLPEHLPIPTPSPDLLFKRITEQIEATFELPLLDAALGREPIVNAQLELQAIIEELYLKTYQTRVPATILEQSALELPELFTIFFAGIRRNLLTRLTRYIQQRVEQRHFLPIPDPTAAARFLLESVTFFARHRYLDPDLSPGDDTLVRETILQLVVRSFLKGTSTED